MPTDTSENKSSELLGDLPATAPEPVHMDLEGRICELLSSNSSLVLLTILSTEGHVSRKAGSRAILTATNLEGTLGGGLFELRAAEEASRCLLSGESCLFTYTGVDDAGRGVHNVLCEYLSPESAELFNQASLAIRQGIRGGWMVDVTRSSSPLRSLLLDQKMNTACDSVLSDGRILARMMSQSRGKAFLRREAGREIYFEPLLIAPVLLLCGAGHIARACARLAYSCGFTVDVCDSREGFATYERFPMARSCLHLPNYEGLVPGMRVGSQHFVVIMTPEHTLDFKVLSQILSSSASYIGLLGSSVKRRELYARLRALGIPSTELAAVHCPVGLSIGAETPEQIAVSIVAELIASRTGNLKQLHSAV